MLAVGEGGLAWLLVRWIVLTSLSRDCRQRRWCRIADCAGHGGGPEEGEEAAAFGGDHPAQVALGDTDQEGGWMEGSG